MASSSNPIYKTGCIFCKILKSELPANFIKTSNSSLKIFHDIKPASKIHLLAIPTTHINLAQELSSNTKKLYLQELRLALGTLENEINEDEIFYGYHIGKWTSVKHAHIHLIYPRSEMNFLNRLIFRDGTWWCKELKMSYFEG